MSRYTLRLFLVSCLCSILVLLGSHDSFALDPMFEIDTKALRSTDEVEQKTTAPQAQESAKGTSLQKPHVEPRVSGRRNGRDKAARASSASKKSRHNAAGHRATSRRKSHAILVGETRQVGRNRDRYSREVSPGQVTHAFRMSTMSHQGIQWTRDIWGRIFQSGHQDPVPLVVEGRNFSLSLDPERYPVLPAADGGKIIIDEARTLSPLVKTILREKDPGIRIVTASSGDQKSYFSALLAAAGFYSVEENFSVDFGRDPKVTVISDFKIEKTSESLLKNDVVLVNLAGKRKGMPQLLVSFLGKEGFRVVESSPVYAEEPDGQKVLYCIDGSNQDTIVDDFYSALSVRSEKNKELLLDDGSLSGVTLTVRADRYSESQNRKVVVSFSEENPVQYTLLRLLELKGYRVVMLNPEDDFKEISEKLLTSLGLPAVYGMQHLWVPDGTPFTVQLSGFVVPERERNGTRRFLTNVPIDPLVGELARYKGFDVVVK